jgi:hypothetical protein
VWRLKSGGLGEERETAAKWRFWKKATFSQDPVISMDLPSSVINTKKNTRSLHREMVEKWKPILTELQKTGVVCVTVPWNGHAVLLD